MLYQILSYLVQIKSNLFCIVLTLHYLCIEILTKVSQVNEYPIEQRPEGASSQ